VLQVENLGIEQIDLLKEISQVEPIGFREVLGERVFLDCELVAAIEFSAKVVDADAARGTLLDEAQACSHDIAEVAEIPSDFVCLRNEAQVE
jgi:hypothetical protein